MADPKKNVAYDFYLSLVNSAAAPAFRVDPTIAAGDFRVSTDGGAFADLDTLPVVTPAGSKSVRVALSASEMNGDKVSVEVEDQAGGEWDPVSVFIDVSENTVDDVGKGLFNKQVTSDKTGKNTLFDDDDVGVLREGDVFEDAAGTIPYRGDGINFRGKMT